MHDASSSKELEKNSSIIILTFHPFPIVSPAGMSRMTKNICTFFLSQTKECGRNIIRHDNHVRGPQGLQDHFLLQLWVRKVLKQETKRSDTGWVRTNAG